MMDDDWEFVGIFASSCSLASVSIVELLDGMSSRSVAMRSQHVSKMNDLQIGNFPIPNC